MLEDFLQKKAGNLPWTIKRHNRELLNLIPIITPAVKYPTVVIPAA